MVAVARPATTEARLRVVQMVAGFSHMETPDVQPPQKNEEPIELTTPTLSAIELEILKLQAKYAWDWWEFHGRQRMSMFNYFLLVTGVLVNGYLVALKESLYAAAVAICLFGMLQCLSFLMIDIRNRTMLYFAADVLEWLEKDYLFKPGFGMELGPWSRAIRAGASNWWFRISQMSYWIRVTNTAIATGFFVALADSICFLPLLSG